MKKQVWLSPMEGVSDQGFRKLCLDHGADMSFTEMIRADALIRGNSATQDLIDTHIACNQGIQLLVSKPDILCRAIAKIDFTNVRALDLNFGCPSPDVIKIGAGPALLKRTLRMKQLIDTLKEYSPVPCGIKIRLGLNQREKENKVYLRIVELANHAKLDWITVHAKTAAQTSREPIDKDALQEILEIARIPVIASGFITNQKSAIEMFEMGCSGVMIAKAAIANPWVFEEIKGKKVKKDYTKEFEKYKKIATKYGTKPKFFNYHQKMFALRLQGDMKYHAPHRVLGSY